MASENQMKCNKCGCSLKPAGVMFSYLDSKLALDALRCPKCGNILITEALVDGKIHATETFLEDRRMLQTS